MRYYFKKFIKIRDLMAHKSIEIDLKGCNIEIIATNDCSLFRAKFIVTIWLVY